MRGAIGLVVALGMVGLVPSVAAQDQTCVNFATMAAALSLVDQECKSDYPLTEHGRFMLKVSQGETSRNAACKAAGSKALLDSLDKHKSYGEAREQGDAASMLKARCHNAASWAKLIGSNSVQYDAALFTDLTAPPPGRR